MTYPKSAFGPAADEPTGAARAVPVVPSPRFPAIEDETLAFWAADDTFRASIARRAGPEEWGFYEAPPLANDIPHYGSLVTRTAKGALARYQPISGRRARRG